jgi:hypothetical protein
MHAVTVDLGDYAIETFEDIGFDDQESLLGSDLVVFDLSHAASHYRHVFDTIHEGLPYLKENARLFRRAIERRRGEVEAILEAGAVVVSFTPPTTTVYVTALDQTNAGKGKVLLDRLSALQVLPDKITSESGGGVAVNATAQEPFRAFFENAGKLRYDGFLTSVPPSSTVLAKIRGTESPISIHRRKGNGHVLVLPRPAAKPLYNDEGTLIEGPSLQYFDALLQLIHDLTTTQAVSAPAWADSYFLPGERVALSSVNTARGAVTRAQQALADSEQGLRDIRDVKRLLYADGTVLEKAVEAALSELGFSIEPREVDNRVDIIAKADGKTLALEVKGLVKSATEQNAAELEKWVTSYNDGKGPLPKGVLVVNHYRLRPLDYRQSRAAFPHSMLKFSIAREHCLITTVQLLGLLIQARAKPSQKRELRKTITGTVGKYAGFENALDFLEIEGQPPPAV